MANFFVNVTYLPNKLYDLVRLIQSLSCSINVLFAILKVRFKVITLSPLIP